MLTYDDATEVQSMAQRYRMQIERVPMKSTHHAKMFELVITKPPTKITWMFWLRVAWAMVQSRLKTVAMLTDRQC
jgi:hypothetical protein